MPVATWKAHDTYPPLQAALSDSNGMLDLSTASQVRLVMKSTSTPTQVLLSSPMTIASAAGGFVTYAWGATDLRLADTYNVEFEISWSAGGIETVPNDVYDQILVVQDLENA